MDGSLIIEKGKKERKNFEGIKPRATKKDIKMNMEINYRRLKGC